MFTFNVRTLQVLTLLFISSSLFASNVVSAQSYHRTMHSVEQLNGLPDSAVASHLEVSIHQPDKNNMKFHIAILNPETRTVTVSIQKMNDVLFSESFADGHYENIYDMTQLEDGNYVIIITGGKEKIRKNISIHTETRVERKANLN